MIDQRLFKGVFLDRDGVLNKALVRDGKPYPPANLEELVILPGVVQAVKLLKEHGYMLVVVTNQPDVAKGKTRKEVVEQINDYLRLHLDIDDFRTCFHDSEDRCECRKPMPGSILAAAESKKIDLSQSFMVGDRWRDVEAGQAAGVKTIFIDYGYEERQPVTFDFKALSLIDSIPFILGKKV